MQASGAVVGAAPTTAAVQEAATKAAPPAAADDDEDDSDEDVDLFGEMTEVRSSDITLRLGWHGRILLSGQVIAHHMHQCKGLKFGVLSAGGEEGKGGEGRVDCGGQEARC